MKTYVYAKTCTQMLIADLFVISQNRKQPKGPSAGKMVKHTVVHSHNGILLSNKKELLIHVDNLDGPQGHSA